MVNKTKTSGSENTVTPSTTGGQEFIDKLRKSIKPPTEQEIADMFKDFDKKPDWPLATMKEDFGQINFDILKDLRFAREEINRIRNENENLKNSVVYLQEAVKVLSAEIEKIKRNMI